MLSAELLHFKLELRVRIRFRNTKRNGSIRMICQNIITINLLRDLSNAVLLRSDMHTIFDQRKLVFFPRDNGPNPFVVHMLQPTVDVGQLYHNTCIHIHACGLEFLFARFAWTIFPFLSGFLSRTSNSRLVIQVGADGRSEVELSNPVVLAKKAVASRSNSPTKRSRVTSNLDDEVEESSKRSRIYSPNRNSSSSFTCSTSEDDCDFDKSPLPSILDESDYINALRKKALIQQRPAGYQRLTYDRH